ncbi:MAG: hypothetical protein K8I02_13485 [Candidatus Methylomirabilis sp.]|nr:hypothetical protein [Deltaproteobacteria bacterium]
MPRRQRSLTEGERAIVAAIAEVALPSRAKGFDAPSAVGAVLRTMPYMMQPLYCAGLRALDLLPALVIGRFARMRALAPRDRERYLHRVAEHPLYGVRMLFKGIAGLCLSAYWYDEGVARAIDYVPENGPGWPRAERGGRA